MLETKRLMRSVTPSIPLTPYKGIGFGKRKKPEEGRTQKGKGGLISPGAWYQLEETPWKGIGRGKRKRPQEGGFAFGPYTRGLSGIEKKRRPSQKGGRFRKIPNWECYKG